ncbi:MAG: HAD hydrolase-like protein [bacterium]
MIKLIILDFDGVIVESVGIKTQAFKELFKDQPELIVPFIDYHLKNNGKSRFAKFEWLYQHILKKPLPPEEKAALGEKFSQLVYQKVIECPYVDGAIDLLEEFYNVLPIYVASITPQAELESIIEKRKITKYFKNVMGGIGNKAELIDQILQLEGIDHENVLFVGDTMEDYRAAQETGVNFFARVKQEKFEGIPVKKDENMRGVSRYLKENSAI